MMSTFARQAVFKMTACQTGENYWALLATLVSEQPDIITFSIVWTDNLNPAHYVEIPLDELETFIRQFKETPK